MEEALEILWTYARRQAIDCNGKVVIPTINQSIAAIRLIIRLEGARKNNEKKVKSKASENLALVHRREEQKVIREERRVINVADYAPFEEEEEEEDVSPFAPFLLDEDDWSCSADNQLPKETPLSTIHYSLSTQKLPSLIPVAETPYHQQLKSCAKKYFSKYMITQPFSNGKCQPTTSCKRPYIAIDRPYDGFPTKKQHPTLHYFSIGITQAELLSNVRPPPKSLELVRQINSRKTTV
ncbi:MAG: hypothetical protein ACFNYA_06250 [Capnocytophaga granulosa]